MKPIRMTVLNVDLKHKTAIVESNNGNRFPVTIVAKKPISDMGLVVKSPVSREWLLIDDEA